MPKVKNIAYPAIAGFVLSFFISILVTHNFGISLLKGLLFAVIFAVLAFVIDFVWGRFLGDGTEVVELSSDSSKNDKSLGNKVDITIDDADLSDDGRSLPFAVDRNRAKLSESDTLDLRKNDVLFAAESKGEKQPLFESGSEQAQKSPVQKDASPSAEEQPSFKPVSLGKPVAAAADSQKTSPSPSVSPAPVKSEPAKAPPARKTSSGDGELDALPDIAGFDVGDNYVSESDIEEESPVEDSSSYSPSEPMPSGDANKATEHDTETLAKAISTVLKRDEMS